MPSVALNGADIHYETAGSGSAVLLLHAGIADSEMWDGQVEALAGARRVVRYDLRGYGASTLPAGPFSHLDDLEGLLDHLGIEAAALVGCSFGGRIALEFALERPERASALVLVASALGEHEWSREVQAVEDAEEAALEAGDIEAAVELNLRLWVDGPRRAAHEVAPAVRERVGAMYRNALERMVAAYAGPEVPGPAAWPHPPAVSRLGELAVPTLVLVGDDDVDDMLAIAERLAAGIPGARKVVIPGAAHMLSMEQPDAFTGLVRAFLAERAE